LTALAVRRVIEREADRIVRTLYTCPKSALGPFETEFTSNGYRVCVLRHGTDNIPADADTVLVANSAMLCVHCDRLRDWLPVFVVLDEAAAFKNATAARTKAVYGPNLDGVGGIIEGVKYIIAMSGTLAPNNNSELFPHLRALAPASLLDEKGNVMRRYRFDRMFCEFGPRRRAGRGPVEAIVGSRNSGLLRERIKPFVVRTTLREIAPTLPSRRDETVRLARADLDLNELAAIADIEDEKTRIAVETLAAAISGGLVPEPDIDRETTKLIDMIGGGEALAHLRRAWGTAKIFYVEDVVQSRIGGRKEDRTPTLIFNIYHATGDRLEERLRKQGVVTGRIHGGTGTAERNAVITGIQKGDVEAAILQIDCAGTALNLQTANRVIMLEPSWAPGANEQAIARCLRLGQANPVLVSWPVIQNSIDESVLRVLGRKQAGINELWRAAER
jgi:SNF2 family DNA or RNA helicase